MKAQWQLNPVSVVAGSIPALPKFTPAAVNRFIKNEAPAYTDLATAYSSKKQQDLPSAIEKHQAHFVEVGCLYSIVNGF